MTRDEGFAELKHRIVEAALRSHWASVVHVPKVERLYQRLLAQVESEPASLEMTTFHGSCGTTHCLAGWAIQYAGDEGRALERAYGSWAAGTMIFAASAPEWPIPNFHGSNKYALELLRERAQADAQSVSVGG